MPMCPLVDCHTHTSFSDGHASFEDNVRAAAAAGCRVMVSTDHLTLPFVGCLDLRVLLPSISCVLQ